MPISRGMVKLQWSHTPESQSAMTKNYTDNKRDWVNKHYILNVKDGGKRRGWQRIRWLHGITHSMDLTLSKLREIVEGRGVWRAAVRGVTESDVTYQRNNNHLLRRIQVSDPDTCSNEKSKKQVPEPDINCIWFLNFPMSQTRFYIFVGSRFLSFMNSSFQNQHFCNCWF